ncbi:hypothetical protein HDU76_007570 [Blyttiomyces sp. JEL0837]|nr:hypothetical protein HDU76_007570 [Blyttiomyces sp. JEL0837]
MKNLGEYEHEEQTWQKQFEKSWTFGEKAADMVARFGGSWKFIGCLVTGLVIWVFLNITLSAFQAPIIMMSQNRQTQLDRVQSDYISKIVLRAEHQVRHANVKLDHLLSHQWKRLLEIQQTQVDLLQMLQAQHRHLNVHKLANQSTTLNDDTAVLMSPTSLAITKNIPSLNRQYHWSTETQPDAHTRMLLGHHFGAMSTNNDDVMVFARWHNDGDNYVGKVENVRFNIRYPGVVKRIVYDIVFANKTANLDDVFSGEGSVVLRNEMDAAHMHMNGHILRIEVHPRGSSPVAFANGDLPPRYKSAFHLKREDKITDFWKAPVQKVNITYSPPHQATILHLRAGQRLDRFKIDFFPSANVEKARVYVRKIDDSEANVENQHHIKVARGFSYNQQQELFFLGGLAIAGPETEDETTEKIDTGAKAQLEPVGYLREVIGARPLPSTWRVIAHAIWPDNSVPGSNALTATVLGPQQNMFDFGGRATYMGMSHVGVPGIGGLGDGFGDVSVTLNAKSGTEAVVMEASNVTVEIEERWEGPATYVLLCDETKVTYQGLIEEISG